MIDGITSMRDFGILEDGIRSDGEVIPSEDLIGNFINELQSNYEATYDLKWRYLRGEDVEPKHRVDMVKAMMNALGKMVPVDGNTPFKKALKDKVESMLLYIWIISLCKPFNHILFLEDGR